MYRLKLGTLLLATVLLFTACPGTTLLGGFNASLAATKPFIQSLVVQHVISQGKADIVTADIDDGVKAGNAGAKCLSAITASGSAKHVAQGKCYYQVAQDLRAILDRHNLGGGESLNRIASIIGSAIEAFETYYATVTGGNQVVRPKGARTRSGVDSISGEDADKGLESTLKSLNQQLKAVTGK